MPGQPVPPLIQQPFAKNAAAPFITQPIPLTTVDPERASFDVGFPPLTMTEIIAGGKPPHGQDVNGILYMLSAHAAAAQAGQPFLYNATLSAAMGGYAVGAIVGMADGTGLWINTVAGNTTDPDGGGAANWMPVYSSGFYTASGLTGGAITLTPAQYRRGVIVLAGALVGNLQVNMPSGAVGQRSWLIVNTTSGAFSTTVKTAAGVGVIVPPGGFGGPTEVYGDGTNIYPTVAPITLPTDQNPTPLTIAQRTSAGYLFATYFNQNSSLESFAMAAVYADAGDGYHRKISLANFAAQISLSQFAGAVVNAQVPQSAVTQYTAAILASAALTGTPTAPTPSAGDNSTRVATTAFVSNLQSVGLGQTWINQTGVKLPNITYTNSGARPIEVMVSFSVPQSGGSASALVGAVTIMSIGNGSSAANEMPISFIVPPGQTYRLNTTGAVSRWAELV